MKTQTWNMLDLEVYPTGDHKESFTYDNLKWVVAFCDRKGEPKEFFFDTFTMVGFVCKDGRHLLGLNDWTDPAHDRSAAVKSDWDDELSNYFFALGRLNDTVERVKKVLNAPDYRARVMWSVPYPDPRNTEFGPVDGRMLNLSRHADRVAAVKWYIDETLSRWERLSKEGKLDGVKPAGFYWGREGLFETFPRNWPQPDKNDIALVQDFSAYVHGKGLLTYWGPALWGERLFAAHPMKELGLDLAIVQINYQNAENPGRPLTYFDDQTAAARKYGMSGICICLIADPHPGNPRVRSGQQVQLANLEAALRLHWEQFRAHDIYQAVNDVPAFASNPESYVYYEKWHKWFTGALTQQDLQELARDVTANLKAKGDLSEETCKKIEAAPTILEKLHLMERPVETAAPK